MWHPGGRLVLVEPQHRLELRPGGYSRVSLGGLGDPAGRRVLGHPRKEPRGEGFNPEEGIYLGLGGQQELPELAWRGETKRQGSSRLSHWERGHPWLGTGGLMVQGDLAAGAELVPAVGDAHAQDGVSQVPPKC